MPKRQKLSSIDTAWLQMEDPTNLMMITGIMTFDEPISYAALRELIEARFLRFDRFRQRVAEAWRPLGNPSWEDDPHFDIRAHLHRIALPAPGDDAALNQVISDLMSTPLDYTKPLWQMHLIEGYGQGSVLLGRLHHAIADGIALVRVLLSLTDDNPDIAEVSDRSERRRDRRITTLFRPALSAARTARRLAGARLHESMEVVLQPDRLLEAARLGLSATTTVAKMALREPDPATPFKGPLGVYKKAAVSPPVPLADVKAIGQVTGGTVNDVLLTAVAGALRRYLEDREHPVEDLNLRAGIPVNLRPLDAPLELGNRFGLVTLSLPVGIADHVERLVELKRRMDELKDSPEALVAFGLLSAFGLGPAEIEKAFIDFFGSKATAVMTNVPGPRQPIYLAGRRVRHLMAWVPQSGRLGLGVSIISYDGEVLLGVATDANLVPDPERIVDYFADEFTAMLGLVETVAETEGVRCRARTRSGRQCRNQTYDASGLCHIHRSS